MYLRHQYIYPQPTDATRQIGTTCPIEVLRVQEPAVPGFRGQIKKKKKNQKCQIVQVIVGNIGDIGIQIKKIHNI